ncbi:hypothetical protein XA68_13113 [Ophiocordyceps unilateralis]|uniref:ABC transporter domain-containing protein n=1 Tax=Ophiocordyceps unilateralis TaxID=268505 RepID=A0A2A9PBH0_OPHUN|nr:hypothetical protein XA68_13113 [Ophiocordyceps unilateralis]
MDLHRKAAIVAPVAVCLLSAALLAARLLSRARRARHRLLPIATGDEGEAEGHRGFAPSPRAPFALTVVESLALTMDIIVAVALLALGPQPGHQQAQLLAAILSSAYALCLVCFAAMSGFSPTLRHHLMVIYAIQWLVALLAAQHHLFARTPHATAPLMRLPVFTLLLLLRACASRRWLNHMPLQDATSSEIASFASRMSLSWITGLLWKGYRTSLESHHLQHVAQSPKLAQLALSFHQTTSATQPLARRLLAFLKRETLAQAFWAAVASATLFIPIHLLRGILLHMESPDSMRASSAWLLLVGLLVCGLVTGVANAQREWTGQKISAKLRAILTSQKTGAVGSSNPPTADHDAILNLVSVDATLVGEVGAHLHLVWLTIPVHVVIAGCTLYGIAGVSGIVGVASMVALLPLHLYLSRSHAVAQTQALRAAAMRGKLATDIFSNIRTIKLYAWEAGFEHRMAKTRQAELDKLQSRLGWWSACTTACCGTPLLAAVVTLFLYTVVSRHTLTSSVAFPSLAAFALLRPSVDRAADMVSFLPQAGVCLARIESFLAEWETDSHIKPPRARDDSIGFEGATLEWFNPEYADDHVPLVNLEHRPPFRLRSLQIRFVPGGLNVLFGLGGSGKSSLLLALLGEMDLVDGRVHLPLESGFGGLSCPPDNPFSLCSTVAYCPSPPWIQNKTIRDNVTFGLPFHYQRYKAVLDAVSLLQQLPDLPRGDLTEVGDNGEHLSADQRWRVAIARALYSRARYLLVDDGLGEFDAADAEMLVLQAFRGPLMRGRTCILTAHKFRPLMALCDHAVCLADGKVKFQGHPVQLASARCVPAEALITVAASTPPKKPDDDEIEFVFKNFSKAPTMFERIIEARRTPPEPESASWTAIRLYLESMGSLRFRLMMLFVLVVQQLACLGPSLWIKEWTAHQNQMAMFGAATMACIVALLVRDASVSRGALKACRTLHQRLMTAILHAKFGFLQHHPASYMTARYAKDVQLLDRDMAPLCSGLVHVILNLVASLAVISAMLPAFLLVAAPASLICVAAGSLYIRLSGQLKRLSAPQRSALLQHLQETLSGNVSIRAYGQVTAFVDQAYDLTDRDTQTQLLRCAAREWLTFRVACVGAAVSSATGALMLWGRSGVGATGLALTLAMCLDEQVLVLINNLSQSRECFDAVARIKQLIEAEQEPIEPMREPRGLWYPWPQRGSIRFRDYSTHYEPGQNHVLKGIDIAIQGGRRVAVVGDKGAGKTSLAMAMVRRLEAADGIIELDGVNMASLRLDVLRRLVTLVPQDPNPVLFSGTLRDTLDPLLEHSDEDIYKVTQGLQLSRFLSTGLDEPISPALSPSRRQLLCVARALLMRSLVIVIDEATDAMDEEADKAVQTALRDGIAAGTTVVTMAQRLRSIADYDHVIVLAAGRVVEEGLPERLLDKNEEEDRSAFFRSMCKTSGELGLIEHRAGLRTWWILSLYGGARGVWTGERGNRILETHNWSGYGYDLSGIL